MISTYLKHAILPMALLICLMASSRAANARSATGVTVVGQVKNDLTFHACGRDHVELGPFRYTLAIPHGVPISDLLDNINKEARIRGGETVNKLTIAAGATGVLIVTGMLVGCPTPGPERPSPFPPSSTAPPTQTEGVMGRLGPNIEKVLSNASEAEVFRYSPNSRFDSNRIDLLVDQSHRASSAQTVRQLVSDFSGGGGHTSTALLCQTEPAYGIRFRSDFGGVLMVLSIECPRLLWMYRRTTPGSPSPPVPDHLISVEVAHNLGDKIRQLFTNP